MPAEMWRYIEAEGGWREINQIQYMDGVTPRNITEAYYNDAGTWRQVFGSATETLAWSPATPSGTYSASSISLAQVVFSTTLLGAFNFFFSTTNDNAGGTPESGTYRPGATGSDGMNYEINIDTTGITGVGTLTGFGGANINGVWQDLGTNNMGVQISNDTNGVSGSTTVTVEIRQKTNIANTTGPATFTIIADGDGN